MLTLQAALLTGTETDACGRVDSTALTYDVDGAGVTPHIPAVQLGEHRQGAQRSRLLSLLQQPVQKGLRSRQPNQCLQMSCIDVRHDIAEPCKPSGQWPYLHAPVELVVAVLTVGALDICNRNTGLRIR